MSLLFRLFVRHLRLRHGIYMLFLAGDIHRQPRDQCAAKAANFDGLLFPSYFSLLRRVPLWKPPLDLRHGASPARTRTKQARLYRTWGSLAGRLQTAESALPA